MSEGFKPHQKPEALADDLVEVVRDILDRMPNSEEMTWDLHPRTFVMRVKRPKDDPSKDLGWANQIAEFFVRSHAIASRLWADRLAREAVVADLESEVRRLQSCELALKAVREAADSPGTLSVRWCAIHKALKAHTGVGVLGMVVE